MSKSILSIIYFVVLVTFFACGLGPKKLNGFTVYKEPIFKNSLTAPIKFNGFFLEDSEKDIKMLYVFYNNGEVLFGYMKKDSLHIDRDYGMYQINGDTIINQYWGENNNEFYSKWVIVSKFIIQNDTTLAFNQSYSYLDNKIISNKENLFRFQKVESLPSLKGKEPWYLNKKWYLENLHSSRIKE